MKKKKEPFWEPDWVRDDLPARTTPYTEEELDLLTDGVIQGMKGVRASIFSFRRCPSREMEIEN